MWCTRLLGGFSCHWSRLCTKGNIILKKRECHLFIEPLPRVLGNSGTEAFIFREG